MIIGKNRQSRVVEGSVIKTEKIGTAEGRKKRTIYHTPAIIETVVEEPDIEMPQRVVQVRQDVARRGSVVVAPRPITVHPLRNSIATVKRQNTSRFTPQISVKSGYESRNFGVKVTEDLTTIHPFHQDQDQQGCCESCYLSTVNCCRLFKCPFWLCCLIPLVLLLALLAGGYCLNQSHTIDRQRNIFKSNNTFPSQSNILTKQNQSKNESQIVAPIVQERVTKKSQSQSNLITPQSNKKKIVTKIVQVDDQTQIIQKDQYQSNTKKKTQQKVEQSKQQNSKETQNKQSESKETQNKSEQNKQDQNKQIQNKEDQNKDTNNQDSNKEQQKQETTENNSDSNKNQNLDKDQNTTTTTTTTVTNSTSTDKSLPSTKSLISSLLSFNIAPTFKQYWNTTHKSHHLRHLI